MLFGLYFIFFSLAHAEYRLWTSKDGRAIEAEYIKSDKDGITIKRKSDGKNFNLKIEDLAAADQEQVKKEILARLQPIIKYDKIYDYTLIRTPKSRLLLFYDTPVMKGGIGPEGEYIDDSETTWDFRCVGSKIIKPQTINFLIRLEAMSWWFLEEHNVVFVFDDQRIFKNETEYKSKMDGRYTSESIQCSLSLDDFKKLCASKDTIFAVGRRTFRITPNPKSAMNLLLKYVDSLPE